MHWRSPTRKQFQGPYIIVMTQYICYHKVIYFVILVRNEMKKKENWVWLMIVTSHIFSFILSFFSSSSPHNLPPLFIISLSLKTFFIFVRVDWFLFLQWLTVFLWTLIETTSKGVRASRLVYDVIQSLTTTKSHNATNVSVCSLLTNMWKH